MTFERPFDPSLLDFLETRISGWEGMCWRQVFEGTEPLKANVRGARWNPPGVEALYASLSPETATAEIAYLVARQPRPITAPRITYSLSVSLDKVLDLRDIRPLATFGFTSDLLFAENHLASRHLGDAANWLRCDGLLVPSARSRGDNLIVFMNNLTKDNGLEIVAAGV